MLPQAISAKYGVLLEQAGIALRGLFIINPEGVVQQVVGRGGEGRGGGSLCVHVCMQRNNTEGVVGQA